MNILQQQSVLICYSNPPDTSRLRLDLEHRMLDEVMEKCAIDPLAVRRLHATSIEDLAGALATGRYSIVQFSGHGTSGGVCMENFACSSGEIVSAATLADMLQSAEPTLQALLCMSCFSTDSVPELIAGAQFVITATGECTDADVLRFLRVFYHAYFKGRAVQEAFALANLSSTSLNAVMSRRAESLASTRSLIHVTPGMGTRGLILDVSDIRDDIGRLGVARDEFLSILCRKIRIHDWIFSYPRERALLQIGRYFGEFSWHNENDVVVCHRVMALKPGVDEALCDVWTRLIIQHNEAYIDRYRVAPDPGSASNAIALLEAVGGFQKLIGELAEEPVAARLRAAVPDHYVAIKAQMTAYVHVMNEKIGKRQFRDVAVYLECTMSALHDLVNALTSELTVSSRD